MDKDKAIQKVVGQFDFVTVQKIMKLMKWSYHDSDEPPSIERLVSSAIDRLGEAMKHEEGASCSAGGFRATYDPCTEAGESLVLRFVATESEWCSEWTE